MHEYAFEMFNENRFVIQLCFELEEHFSKCLILMFFYLMFIQ